MKALARIARFTRSSWVVLATITVVAVAAVGIGASRRGPEHQQASLTKVLAEFHEFFKDKLADARIVGASMMVVSNLDGPRITGKNSFRSRTDRDLR